MFLAEAYRKTQYADVNSTKINSFCGLRKNEPTTRTADQIVRDLR
jgi:hypothetical protein